MEAMETEIPANRGRGRPKTRWEDRIAEDMIEKGLLYGDCDDRNSWRRLIRKQPRIGWKEDHRLAVTEETKNRQIILQGVLKYFAGRNISMSYE